MAQESLNQLQTAPNALWYRLHVFLYDLRNFSDNNKSQARLDQIIDASYLGQPYFSDNEVAMIKTTIIGNQKTLAETIEESLNDKLNRRKRVEAKDYRPCAAHDLAPIFERAFGVRPKDLSKDKQFLKLMTKHGLALADTNEWKKSTPAGKKRGAK